MENAEKSPFSKVEQIGVIVRDLYRAIEHYESLGIGPFKILKGYQPTERQVYGKPANDVILRIATCQIGAVSLELVQPVSGESIQKEFLETHGEGINHLGFYVEDIDKEVAKLAEKGFKVVASVKLKSGGAAFLDIDKIGGVLFELIQVPPGILSTL